MSDAWDWLCTLWLMEHPVWTAIDRASMVVGLLLGLAAVVGLFNLRWIRARFFGNSFRHVGGDPELSQLEGIVFTLSSQSDTALLTLEKARPGHVVPLSPKPELREDVRRVCERLGLKYHEMVDAVDVHSVDGWRNLTARALQLLAAQGVPASQIGVDLTGGTKPMSLGAFMAAEEAKVRSVYVATDRGADGRLVPGTERPITVSRPAA